MKFIRTAISKYKEYKSLSKALSDKKVPAIAIGLAGIHKCAFIYSLCYEHKKKALIIAADEAEAQRFFEDLTSMGMRPAIFPARDFSFRDAAGVSHEYERLRLETLSKLNNGDIDAVISCADAAVQYTIPPDELLSKTLTVKVNQSISINDVLSALTKCGYVRENQIEGIGQFSCRGGIIDFFSPGTDNPVRIEFWGDNIDSISYFDVESQRRTEQASCVSISPCVEVISDNPSSLADRIDIVASSLKGKTSVLAKNLMISESEKLRGGLHLGSIDKYITLCYKTTATLLDYFDSDSSILFLSESNKLKERLRTTLWQWGEDLKAYLEEGILCKYLNKYSMDWEYILTKSCDIPAIFIDMFARGSYEVPTKSLVNITARQLSVWGGNTQILIDDMTAMLDMGSAIVVLSGSERAGKTLSDDLKSSGLPASYLESPSSTAPGTITVTAGTLSSGFEIPDARFAVLSHGRMAANKVKRVKRDKNSKEISNLSEIAAGDYVVHTSHGIGIFEGIDKLEMNGIIKDYIKIRYAKSDTLYVPVTQLDLVSKYIGPREDMKLKLHRLGGTEWQKTKTRVRSAVKDIAKELIELYARRMQEKGFAFPEDNEWQSDFESRFIYDETEDQLRCVNEIKDDMEREIPMDRLLCGDVGFGKTEVALRAAFKCVCAGKQCAILVPTTILAWQHYQTIVRRMENFPIEVALLSRFIKPKQQGEIIKKLKRGSVDIIVGTHRLISKDTGFRDLGLIIIDEEQRFGVAQKEKLKAMSKNTDVLTLSATPIPRTLNMALSGIRDMSVIEEAPQDRRPVQTYVLEYDRGVVYDAIRKELRRGGQVYYIHNDVASIESTASRIQLAIPNARIGVGHGKMNESELSEVWRKLLDNEIDVLVCTTIIETGVDVPTANTLIIENSDRMGLSQLHQLRGRVGRSSRRAYAYFTYSQNKILTEIAQKRLSAIKEFTEFGSGFKIAMRDLEIRGAGNILGGEQHGHMETVGYDMYIKLLSEAVNVMKGNAPTPIEEECVVDMQVPAHIPERYIDSLSLRLDIYRRIADIKNESDVSDVIDELIDRFGDPPISVQGLIDIALLRNRATLLGIREIKQQESSLLFYKKDIDMKQVSLLVKKFKGRVMINAGSNPYICVKLENKLPLIVLSDVLKTMSDSHADSTL